MRDEHGYRHCPNHPGIITDKGPCPKCEPPETGHPLDAGRTVKPSRAEIHAKYGGRCAYCGQEIPLKGFHVDHLEPIYRGLAGWGERDEEAIKMPACGRCNRWKSVHSLEQFRKEIAAQVDRVRRDSAGFRLAEDFGLIIHAAYHVEFFFESQDLNP